MDPGWPISCTEAPELATPALHGETTESDADSRDHTAAVLCSVLLIRGVLGYLAPEVCWLWA